MKILYILDTGSRSIWKYWIVTRRLDYDKN